MEGIMPASNHIRNINLTKHRLILVSCTYVYIYINNSTYIYIYVIMSTCMYGFLFSELTLIFTHLKAPSKVACSSRESFPKSQCPAEKNLAASDPATVR